jgi:GT2 family glycosyltransferase
MASNLQNPVPLVSIVIVNWNGRSWLAQCLPTIQQQTFTDYEVILVDNGSTDGSVAWLQENWLNISVIPLKINLGFAAANNIGIRRASGLYIVTLNNDTLVDADFLAHMVTAVSAPDIGMIAPQITIWNQPAKLDAAGIEVDWLGTAWNRGYEQPADMAYSADVFGPTAAAALYRREMLAEIGLFDETFFAYYEDVDLAWRARRAGWRCVYAPKAQVRHWHSATGEKTPAYKAYLIGRNKVWCFLKNYPVPAIFFMLPLFLVYDGSAAVIQCLHLKSMMPLNGRLQGWLTARHFWAKRTNHAHPVAFIQISKPWHWKRRLRIPNKQA